MRYASSPVLRSRNGSRFKSKIQVESYPSLFQTLRMETDDLSLGVLSLAQQHAFAFLKNLDDAPVGTTVDVQTLRQQLNKPLADSGLPPEQVITELVHDVRGGLLGSAGACFFDWVIGGEWCRRRSRLTGSRPHRIRAVRCMRLRRRRLLSRRWPDFG
jgi:hypothetical protein